MNCIKCGNKLKRNEEFCTFCGYYNGDGKGSNKKSKNDDEAKVVIVNEPADSDFSDDLFSEDSSENNIVLDEDTVGESFEGDSNDDELIEAYMGSEYGLVSRFPFNPYAFIFSWLYFVFKKMFLYGVCGLALTVAVVIFFRNYIIWYLVISRIIVAIMFNPIYMSIVKKRVNRIVKRYKGTDAVSLRSLCEEKGGSNTLLSLFSFTCFLGVIVYIFVNGIGVERKVYVPKFWEETSGNKTTCNSILKVAYLDIKENYDIGMLDSGTCKVTKGTTKMFDAYLKTKKDNKNIYYYYKAQDGVTSLSVYTEFIDELELKNSNGTITDEEYEDLVVMKSIEMTYNTIIEDSTVEDQAISNNTNSDEKLNFVFTKEEITR